MNRAMNRTAPVIVDGIAYQVTVLISENDIADFEIVRVEHGGVGADGIEINVDSELYERLDDAVLENLAQIVSDGFVEPNWWSWWDSV